MCASFLADSATHRRVAHSAGDRHRVEPGWLWLAILLFTAFYYLLGNEWHTPAKGADGFHSEAVDVEVVADQGKGLWRFAFVGIGFTGLVLLVKPSSYQFSIRNALGVVIVATYAYACVSLLWSEFPSVTLRRLVVLSCTCLGAFGFARQFAPRHAAILAICHCLFVLFLSVASEVTHGTFAPLSSGYRFAGTLHPNQQAIKMAILCIASLSIAERYPRWKHLLWGLAGAAVGVLILTKSRSSFAALAIALFAMWVLGTSFQTKLISFVAAVTLGFIGGAIMLAAGIDDTESLARVMLMGREDDDPTSFTGRLEIWEYVLDDVEGHLWWGHGFNTFWNEERLTEAHRMLQWALPDSHNAYIDTIASIGLIGLTAVMLIAILGTAYAARSEVRRIEPGYTFIFGLCVFGFLNGVFESHMLQPFNFTPFLVACGFFHAAFFAPEDAPSDHPAVGRRDPTV